MSVTHSQHLTNGFGIGKSANERRMAAPPRQFCVRQRIDCPVRRRLLEVAKLVFGHTVGRTFASSPQGFWRLAFRPSTCAIRTAGIFSHVKIKKITPLYSTRRGDREGREQLPSAYTKNGVVGSARGMLIRDRAALARRLSHRVALPISTLEFGKPPKSGKGAESGTRGDSTKETGPVVNGS